MLLEVPSERLPVPSSLPKGVYNPKAFIPHAASLRQAFAHGAIFLTAASRRSLARVAVPVWLVVLSDQLPVAALVGHYPANKLIGHEPILRRRTLGSAFHQPLTGPVRIVGISTPFGELSPTRGEGTHALLTRLPLYNRLATASPSTCLSYARHQ